MSTKPFTPTFTGHENTRIYQSHYGWQGETHVKVKGKNWVLSTLKRHSGTISTHCHVVQDEGGGSYSFMMFGRDENESFYLNELPKGTKATEKTIREAHYKALAMFDEKNQAGELPEASEEYQIEIGQVLFTDGYSNSYRRAIYKIEGNKFYTVLLDGTGTRIDTHIRPWAKKFGIGVYYKEGDKISTEEVNNLVLEALESEAKQRLIDQANQLANQTKAEEKKAYLSQFKQADRRTTTNIIKRHILKQWPQVQKVEVKTDVFSGGDSQNVTYYSPEPIKELESFVSSFKEGRFDGMTDMYEYFSDREPIILEGHILQTYKYSDSRHIEVEPLPQKQVQDQGPVCVSNDLVMVEYSPLSFAIFGDTKKHKDELKAMGGKFNPYLSRDGQKAAGWIFANSKADQVKKYFNL